MKRLTMALSVMAVLAFAAGAWADGFVTIPPWTMDDAGIHGVGYFQFGNWDNGNEGRGTGANFSSPTATTDGAVWVVTGGAPVQTSQDMNISLYWRASSAAPWTTIATVLLNDTLDQSNGATFPTGQSSWAHASGNWDVYASLPPNGYFADLSGTDLNGPFRPAHSSYEIAWGQYYLPNSVDLNFSQTQFRMQCWSGNYSSYSAAAAAGQPVADSGPFTAGVIEVAGDPTSGGGPDLWGAFLYMPAVVLTISGDANYDGKVDINDLSKVLTDYDKSNLHWSDGDFNGDGKVDINDLSVVLTNYDRGLGSSAAGMAAVPEPAGALLLAAAGLVGLLGYARRRRP